MFKKIIKIIRWIPLLWQDVDYDADSIYGLLYYKLKFMEEYFSGDNTWGVDAKKIAKQIKIAKNLAKRLMEDDYLSNALVEHEKKYPDYLELGLSIEQDDFKFYKLVDKNSNEEKKSFRKCSKHADYLKEQDINYLFSYLKKHIKEWWD